MRTSFRSITCKFKDDKNLNYKLVAFDPFRGNLDVKIRNHRKITLSRKSNRIISKLF